MPNILLTLTLWLASGLLMLSAQSNNSAGDLFLRGFNLKSEAEKLEQAGDVNGALAKFQQAQQAIAAIAQNYPDWQPEVVNYRLGMIERSIAKLRGQSAPSSTPALPSPGMPMSPAPAAPGIMQPAPAPMPGAPTGNPLDYLNQQFQAKDQTINELQSKLKVYEDGYTNAVRERNRAQQDIDLLKKQSDDLQRRLAESTQQQGAKDEAARKEVERLRAEAQMVSDMLKTRNDQFIESGKSLDTLQKEKDDLFARNKALEKDLAEAKKGTSAPASDELKKLIADNTRLKKELDGARKQVETLRAEGTKKDQEIASLRTQITGIQSELTKLRQENTAYQGQVAELTVQLKEVNAKLAKAPADEKAKAEAGPEVARAAEENQALRNIIMRQLRQQQRQLQAKEIVIAEMKKLEGASGVLIENLEDMTAGRIRITVEEESLFTEPELKEILATSGGVYATLEANSPATQAAADQVKTPTGENPAAPTPAPANNNSGDMDEDALMAKASEAMRNSDYKGAEWAYQDALRANPKNLNALTNLAGLKLHARQFEEAEVLLQKCLVYDPQNETALYRLGICFFQQNKLAEAKTHFEKSIASNKGNARAHHYLGIITTRQGNRDRAETEFKSALAIDPNYGDAHFNLAVLYATSNPPDWELARKHYKNALDRGIKSDPAMEKLLNDTSILSSLPPAKEPTTALSR
ncbi:tetratricopeptide repeat protein [Phragmitibacter flavus]|uniref:Tetratricopeptide repeat protein n=1 Tax=Phragmitibacter flavus TaxID=2576071 RepID=A0A5R8KFT2_9BACT|nr:tetratricopeptide repeat protein [Phragmitibacter flavus]TLD71091.1 tetratricopeptide repeat protein [Phragmitibacter flavus]